MSSSFTSPASLSIFEQQQRPGEKRWLWFLAAEGGRGQVALGHTEEAAELTKMCSQHPGSASQGKDEDWTCQHTIAVWPQPSFSRVVLLEG